MPNEIAAGKVLVQPPPCCSAFEGIGADGIGSRQGGKVQAGQELQERQPSQLQTQTPAEAELCLSQLRPLVVVTVSKHLPGESLDELEASEQSMGRVAQCALRAYCAPVRKALAEAIHTIARRSLPALAANVSIHLYIQRTAQLLRHSLRCHAVLA